MTTVEMTAEERQEFEAYKLAKEKKTAEAKRKSDREAYTALVDETIAAVMPELTNISETIAQKKTAAAEAFRGVLEMKAELFGVKDDQQSHTFTNSEGTMRITIGHYMLDNYRDTVNEGIAMVKTYIESQARDDASRALVKAILRLLSRDAAGNLQAAPPPHRRQPLPRGPGHVHHRAGQRLHGPAGDPLGDLLAGLEAIGSEDEALARS